MDFEFNEQQEMFRKAVRTVAQTEIAPLVEEAERNEKYPVQLFPLFGDLGFLCVTFPLEYGGAGMGKVEECIEWEEMSRVSFGITGAFVIQSGLPTFVIKNHGTESQRQKYLIPAVKGKKIASFALTEPNAGSDAGAIESTARKDGQGYLLNGTKMYITNGMMCDFMVVAACTDKSKGYKGISLFVVERGTPGLCCTKLHKFCVRSSDTAEVVLDNCRVSEDSLIGEEGRGMSYLMESLEMGRITHASRSLGAAQSVLEMSIEYAKQRVQFGRPIASFQAIAFKLSRMALAIESARWMVYRAAWLFDSGKPCAKESSMAKLVASEAYQQAATEAMQIHGGVGVLTESAVNRHYRDSYVGRITEGTSEIQEIVIARQLGIQGI